MQDPNLFVTQLLKYTQFLASSKQQLAQALTSTVPGHNESIS